MPIDTHHLEHTVRCWWNHYEARWVCDPHSAESSEACLGQDSLVDIRDMLVVHTALLREFRLMSAAVARTEPGAAGHATAVDRHLGFLCDLLHHHHHGEDELLWPVLRDRGPAAARILIDEVESQHAGIDQALQSVGAARLAWHDAPDAETTEALVDALRHLHGLLKAHLDLEESALLPLAASVLTSREWQLIGETAAAAMPRSVLLLAFGMFAYEADPEVLREMLAAAPRAVRLIVPRVAPRVYAKQARRVHGTRRP